MGSSTLSYVAVALSALLSGLMLAVPSTMAGVVTPFVCIYVGLLQSGLVQFGGRTWT